MFGSAKQAEIIRSNQKDEYYLGYIRSSFGDLVQTFLGPRAWMKWRKELDVIADATYFALTTFAGYQTLGEEYVNVVQVDESLRRLPSPTRRGLMIALHVLSPYLIGLLLLRLERNLQRHPPASLTLEGRAAILDMIPVMRHIITVLHRCHLAVFYMRGIFYHLAKRFTSIHYILVRTGLGPLDNRPSYRILGWLSIIQLTLTFAQQLYRLIQNRKKSVYTTSRDEKENTRASTTADEQLYASTTSKCSLCLEPRRHSTATPCGHLFCWTCIMEWHQNKPECPLCREHFQMSRLILLQNYDPS